MRAGRIHPWPRSHHQSAPTLTGRCRGGNAATTARGSRQRKVRGSSLGRAAGSEAERTRSAAHDPKRGSVTFFGLAIVLITAVLSGIAIDCWRVVEARSAATRWANSVAAAAANGIDTDRYYATGVVQLDAAVARDLGAARIADGLGLQKGTEEFGLGAGGASAAMSAGPEPNYDSLRITSVDIAIVNDTATVTVTGEIDLLLLDALSPSEPMVFTVTASASPR